jgi:hypothetical protein
MGDILYFNHNENVWAFSQSYGIAVPREVI